MAVDIYIVGLGTCSVHQVTREAELALRECNEVLYLDTGIATRPYLESICPRVTSLYESSYEEGEHRLAVHRLTAIRARDGDVAIEARGALLEAHGRLGVEAVLVDDGHRRGCRHRVHHGSLA